jgi:hypothetical protein
MGSGISSAITTHSQLFDKTKGTRRMVDDIFTYMMHHIKVNDFMTLSNPDSCKKYTLFMANNLSMFFSKLSVIPQLGKDGALAFRSMEDLEEPKGPAKQEKESLCLLLAYFYTRIFQIYGAMALTLLDDVNYTVERSTLVGARPSTEDKTDRSVPTPGQPYTYVEPRRPERLHEEQDGGQMGGWISTLGYFDFLNRGLLVDKPPPQQTQYQPPYGPYPQPLPTREANQYGFTANYVLKDDSVKNKYKYMYFKPEAADAGGRDVTSTGSQKGVFTWVDTQKKIFEINVSMRKGGNDKEANFSVDSIRFRRTRETTDTVIKKEEIKEVLSREKIPETITISSDQAFPSTSPQYPPTNTYQTQDYTTINAYVKGVFEALIPYVTKQYSSGDSVAGHSKIDAMNIRRFYENYTTRKPLGHCIARALQLLNADPSGGDEKGKQFVSSICKTSFFVPQGKKESIRKGVPTPEKSITDESGSPGIASLALLFYDTIGKATPRLFMSESSFEQYKILMKRMAGLFMGKEATAALHIDQMTRQSIHPKTVEEERERTALTTDRKSEVKDLRTFSQSDTKRGLCSSDQKDKVIPLDTDTKQNVHAVVRKLFERQMNHAAKCEGILRQMFTIRREENLPVQIKISDALLKGGVAALNKINSQVRQILIEYYSDCESMYLTGVRHIEHQGILKKQKEDAQKKQAAQLVQKQAVEKAAAQAQIQAQTRAPPQQQVQGQPQAPVAQTQQQTQVPPQATISRGPVPAKEGPLPPPAAKVVVPLSTQAQAALLAEERNKKREELRIELEAVGPVGLLQLTEDLKKAKINSTLIENIMQRINRYELSYNNVREALRTGGPKGVTNYITTASNIGPRRSARRTGGTRKNITSSYRMTHRLLR